MNEILKISYYAGEKELSRKRNLEYYLKKACKTSNIGLNKIKDIFQMEETFYKEELRVLFRCSYFYDVMIGFAMGKKVFCYPWYGKSNLFSKSELLKKLHEIARANDLIIIIPIESNSLETSNKLERFGHFEPFEFNYNIVNWN